MAETHSFGYVYFTSSGISRKQIILLIREHCHLNFLNYLPNTWGIVNEHTKNKKITKVLLLTFVIVYKVYGYNFVVFVFFVLGGKGKNIRDFVMLF